MSVVSPVRTLAADLTRAAEKPGVPVNLHCACPEWPLDLLIGKRAAGDAAGGSGCRRLADDLVAGALEGKRLLVLGASLGNWIPPVPVHVLKTHVVLMLRSRSHYGCRQDLYQHGIAETWRGRTAAEPCSVFWAVVAALVQRGLGAEVSLLGTSAGVDAILSMLATRPQDETTKSIRIRHVVCVAGVYHPTVFPEAAKVLRSERACVLVHHHALDKLCPWPEAGAFWRALAAEEGMQVYINVLSMGKSPLLENTYHNVSKFLLAQESFWHELQENAPQDFLLRCAAAKLGCFHETLGRIADPGYDVDIEDKAHFLAFALCACTAADLSAGTSGSPREWVAGLGAFARSSRCSLYSKEYQALLQQFGDFTQVVDTSVRAIPALFLEGVLQAGHGSRGRQTTVFKAGHMAGHRIAFSVHWQCGPLVLVQVTFPWEFNASKYADAMWSHALSVPRDCDEFRDARTWPLPRSDLKARHSGGRHPGGLQQHVDQAASSGGGRRPAPEGDSVGQAAASSGSRRPALPLHHVHQEQWERIAGDADSRDLGFKVGDLTSLALLDGRGYYVGELVGVVQDAVPKPRTRSSPVNHAYPSEVWLWCRDGPVTALSTSLAEVSSSAGPHVEISSCIVVKLHGTCRGILSWMKSVRSRPDLCCVALALKDEQPQSRSQPGPIDVWVDSVRAQPDLLPERARNQEHAVPLCQALGEPVTILYGPPGTGKTEICTMLVNAMAEAVCTAQAPAQFRSLHCAWTRQATGVMLDRFLKLFPGTLEFCVFVGNEEARAKYLAKYPQLTCMDLTPSRDWSSLWGHGRRRHVFVTVGTAMAVSHRFAGAVKSWLGAFDVIHVDEATQVLQAYSLHLPRFLRKRGKLLLSGDPRQLPGFSHSNFANYTLMRAAMTVVKPVFLPVQHRQDPGLSTLVSTMFYEGEVVDGAELARAVSKGFLMVTWENSATTPQEEAYPAATEATLVSALWSALGWDQHPSCKLVSFYKAQNELLRRRTDTSVCAVLDGCQGREWEVGIISAGRVRASWNAVGFLQDRRRVNVALSRFKKCCVLVVHSSLGEYGTRGGPAQQFWWRIRELARATSSLVSLGDVAGFDVQDLARDIARRLKREGPLDETQVRQASQPHAAFFKSYQVQVVGAMHGVSEALESDDDAEARPAEDVDRDDDREAGDLAAGEAIATELEAEHSQEMAARDVPLFVGATIAGTWTNSPESLARYGFVNMSKLNHLWHAATVDMTGADVTRLLDNRSRYEQLVVVQNYAMWAFAAVMYTSLQSHYATHTAGLRAEEDIDVDALLAAEIRYPNQAVVTLGDLVRSRHACYYFLRDLFGDGSRPFFQAYAVPKEGTAQRRIRSMCWDIMLPYALVSPLVAGAVDKVHRFDREDRVRNYATKYGLDVPVQLQTGAWSSLREVKRASGEVARGSAFSEGVVTFAPYDCSTAARCDGGGRGGGALLADAFETLKNWTELAQDKERWWYAAMRAELSG